MSFLLFWIREKQRGLLSEVRRLPLFDFPMVCRNMSEYIPRLLQANHTIRLVRNTAEDVNVNWLPLRCSVSAVECSSEPVYIV
jgi:hypothetical protein